MKNKNLYRLIWVSSVLILAILACQGTNKAPGTSTSLPSTSSPAQAQDPTSDPVMKSDVPTALPQPPLDSADDVDSSSMATSKNVTSGDTFVQGQYERPFNANAMDTYFPYLDIVHIKGYKDSTWGYLEITLHGDDKNGKLPGEYAAELDIQKTGRGMYLIRASNPSSTSWTTKGVQAWKDTNGDVGGAVSILADSKPAGGDGFETVLFDQGKGDIADGAWVRISPDDPKTVQIAFKLSMVGSPSSFAMGAWAGTNLDPAMFDFNDHMTHAQAGDPNQANPQVYPIKALAEIDNTCRLAIGFVPTSAVPGLCQTPKIQHGGAAPPPPPPPPGITVPG